MYLIINVPFDWWVNHMFFLSDSADRFCYEKLNSEGTDKGNCGPDPSGQGWAPCNKQWANSRQTVKWSNQKVLTLFFLHLLSSSRDVLCGLLLCTNLTERPRFGELQGKLTSLTIHHQNRYMDCRWSSLSSSRREVHLILDSKLVECDEWMSVVSRSLILLRFCAAAGVMLCWMMVWIWATWRTGHHVGQTWCVWNAAASPSPPSTSARVRAPHSHTSAPSTGWVHTRTLCSAELWGEVRCWLWSCVLQICSNEVKCICDADYTGKDCSVFDPIPTPTSPDGLEKHKGNCTEEGTQLRVSIKNTKN